MHREDGVPLGSVDHVRGYCFGEEAFLEIRVDRRAPQAPVKADVLEVLRVLERGLKVVEEVDCAHARSTSSGAWLQQVLVALGRWC